MLDLAIAKLCYSNTSKDYEKGDAGLAVLSQRFALNVAFGHCDSLRFIERAIHSHMRICVSITQDRLWSSTEYPSEPYLSNAAAVAQWEDGKQRDFFWQLKLRIFTGMIDSGKSGELASRLLLLLAKEYLHLKGMDNFSRGRFLLTPAENEHGREELFFCRPVRVLDYLEALLGLDIFKQEDGSQIDREAIESAYGSALLNFSHWGSMSSNIHTADQTDWRYVYIH